MYIEKIKQLSMNMEYITKLSRLSELRGLYKEVLIKKDEVKSNSLLDSVISTSAIEGVVVSTRTRAKELINDSTPSDKNEIAFAQAAKLMSYIFSDYDQIQITKSTISNLHNLLMKDIDSKAGVFVGGKIIEEIDNKTKVRTIIHNGSNSILVEEHIQKLIDSYNHTKGHINSFVHTCLFISEFLAIHPFNDGNGRIARALFNLMLLQNEYYIGKVTSIDSLIEANKTKYYSSLKTRSIDWNSKEFNVNSNIEFIYLMIDIVYEAYTSYDIKQKQKQSIKKKNKKELVLKIISMKNDFGVKDILDSLNHTVSRELVSKTLSEETLKGNLIKTGKGKGTKYKKV